MKIRKANRKDIPEIVQLLSNDKFGKLREDYREPLPEKYYDAFDAISQDHNQELVIIEDDTQKVVGTLQLTFIPYLTYQGGIRAQIEAVRVHENYRSKGIGKQLFEWAIQRARQKGAHVVQLTTDKKRPEAFKFYENLGFKASHEGMKLHL
ncbi:GNAT family N-acetyltransferase [Zobellia roscoffensis]|uniref:GNAT family N-acetyltransferase n=1 Tax=Zobellia roscoffensis TaxID=2779508 RepID=UPI00188BDD84|nr:GNAT family N-acetyltransferase [Zobellia roscoffensis]